MTRAVVAVALLLLALLALRMMRAGWKARAARTAALGIDPVAPPADLGAVRVPPVPAVYVSTTRAEEWLERVVAHGLGVRSPAEVSVHDAGVLVERRGAPDLFLPRGRLTAVGAGPAIAGKAVGGDGLLLLDWRGDDTGVAPLLRSGLRLRRRADQSTVVAAVEALLAPSTADPATSTAAPPAPPTDPTRAAPPAPDDHREDPR
ncbi:hypothetical protein [Cellulomonas marina]|uniref:PH domain-containing protein n=1 Tax=Cellulomonas marina TaxID=988821 RepID=A0A1I0W973_9CELL|nr:hypothetical protein [Cellulomonas marina]GIG29111.1 hypothetical protein Cma02nite_17110 [Cellulomonas marina]SFA84887.1 hypothetical protein SAMN05421867_102269 [Cellulomonas marina]